MKLFYKEIFKQRKHSGVTTFVELRSASPQALKAIKDALEAT